MARQPIIDNGSGGIGRFPAIVLSEDGALTEQQAAWMSGAIQAIVDAMNGQLSLGTGDHATRGGNIAAQWLDVYFKNADDLIEIPHGLLRVPTDVFFGLPDKAASFYSSARGSWTDSLIYFASDTADVTVKALVF